MIPYNTDAPLYHLPIGTALLMFANLACFAVHGPLDGLNPWILAFGNTLNPLEWLSSLFAHDGAVHLAGNMYFLAVFGVIVEGKLGWRRFVPLYLSIGLIDSGLTQLIMLPASGGGAVGASSAIMSLMAICLVWAPRNELSLAFWCLFRLLLFEVSIFAYAMFYIVWETVWLVLFQMSTPALHLIGIAVGLVAGALYVKKGWVDCENWDLFAVMAGTYGRFGDEATTVGSHADAALLFGKDVDVAQLPVPEPLQPSHLPGSKLQHVDRLIDDSKFFEASEELFSLRIGNGTELLTESRLRRLASGLQDANAVDEAEVYLHEYLERFNDRADWCRLRLAQILLHDRRRPDAALKRLNQVRLSRLTAGQQKRAKNVAAAAKRLVNSGIEDADDELNRD
jgi:membrane associated rhomboid family serine protease